MMTATRSNVAYNLFYPNKSLDLTLKHSPKYHQVGKKRYRLLASHIAYHRQKRLVPPGKAEPHQMGCTLTSPEFVQGPDYSPTMPIDIYCFIASPPSRSVMLTAKAVGVELNRKVLDMMTGEHLKPEYLQINPLHTVPTIIDDGLILSESRAIQVYLATKYGKDDTLYPNDARKRGLVQQRLLFDMGTLYQRLWDVYRPAVFAQKPINEDNLPKLKEALDVFDSYLSQSKWAAGDQVTIADHSLVASIGTFDAVRFDLSPYENITRWYKQCQEELPGYQETIQEGVNYFKEFTKDLEL